MKRGERNAEWIEARCRVPEGALVGQPIKLHPFQRKILSGIYDSPTRQAIISLGRKNGKTALSAMLALLHLVGPEAKRNSQIYSTGQSRKQAAVLFELAAKMIRMSPELHAYVQIRDSAKELLCPEIGTTYRALSAEVPTAYGLSPAVVIHDELGQVRGPTSLLYDALETAMGAHESPLSIVISTQAPTDGDLLSVLIDDAALMGDRSTKLFLYTAPITDDPWAKATWRKSCPMLGKGLSIKEIASLASKAKRMPSQEASFRNLTLNQRIDQVSPFIPQAVWKRCEGEPDPTVLEAHDVYGALDLSAKNDLTAFVYGAHDEAGEWHIKSEFWAPLDGIADRSSRDRVPYALWSQQGWITATPGASVNYDFVAYRLAELHHKLRFVAVAFDRWHIDELKRSLDRLAEKIAGGQVRGEGLDCAVPLVEHGQGYKDMTPAIDALEGALMNGKVRHGGHPILTWCAANAKAIADEAGNRKLDKKRSTGRIDGLVAMAMLFRAEVIGSGNKPKTKATSVYESGVL